jgi:hypothetical protein
MLNSFAPSQTVSSLILLVLELDIAYQQLINSIVEATINQRMRLPCCPFHDQVFESERDFAANHCHRRQNFQRVE